VTPLGKPWPNTAMPGARLATLVAETEVEPTVVATPARATALPSKPVFDEVTTKVPLLFARRLKVWACRVLIPVPRPPEAVEPVTTC